MHKTQFGTIEYLKFLNNEIKTPDGATYTQIMNYNDTQLEDNHNFIQWIFPLTVPSKATLHNHPIINDFTILNKHINFARKKMALSFILMTRHWGIKTHFISTQYTSCIKNPFPQKNLPPFLRLQVHDRNALQLLNFHDSLRLSRMLQSLVYHNYKNLATYLLNTIIPYTNTILTPMYHPSTTTTEWAYRMQEAISLMKKIEKSNNL